MSSTHKQQQNTTSSNGQHPIAQQLATLQSKKQQPAVAASMNGSKPSKPRFGWTGFQGKTLWDWLQYLELNTPPSMTEENQKYFFRHVRGTQNPSKNIMPEQLPCYITT